MSGEDEVPYVAWKGTSTRTANEALALPERFDKGDEERQSKRRARQYEIEALLDEVKDGPKTWAAICEALKADDFKPRTLERARADAGLLKVTGQHGQSSTMWALPSWVPPGVDKGQSKEDDDTDSKQADPHSAISPLRQPPTSGPSGNGEMAEWDAVANPALPAVDLIEDRQPSDVSGTYADSRLTNAERDELLDAAERVCDVCGTVDKVSRYGDPHWVIRCLTHWPYNDNENQS